MNNMQEKLEFFVFWFSAHCFLVVILVVEELLFTVLPYIELAYKKCNVFDVFILNNILIYFNKYY